MEAQGIRVECYAGYRADERPTRFYLEGRAVDIVEVLDSWIGADHRYFKVRGGDGDLYILRHDTTADRWELTLYERGPVPGNFNKKEDMALPVEFVEGRPVAVVFPDIVEATVADTAPPAHTQGMDNVWKAARLENGVTLMVPPFIAPGEVVRVEVESGKYVERAKTDRKKP